MPMIVLSKSAILMVAIGKTKAPIAPPQRWVAAQLFLIESVNLHTPFLHTVSLN